MYQFSSSGQYVGFSFRIFHFISSRLYLVCNFNLSLLSAFSFWCFEDRKQNLFQIREPSVFERTELTETQNQTSLWIILEKNLH